jgi:superfamily II DNA/RNA helicase
MENFKLLKIEDSLKNSLQKMNFTKPTPIQGYGNTCCLRRKRYFRYSTNRNREKL